MPRVVAQSHTMRGKNVFNRCAKDGLSADNINSQTEYAKMRLRDEIATANYSTEAGIQVLLEADPQILKAIESMPRASGLVASVNRQQ